jgi:hypothetical protein
MRHQCDEAEAQLRLTSSSSATLLERASALREERSVFSISSHACLLHTLLHSHQVETRKSILTLFLSRFTLSDAEVAALTSRDVPVGQRFFDAMDRTERIRHDCTVLMAGEDGPTQAG